MKIVIAGGAGFLGQKLCRRLLDEAALTDAAGSCRPIARIVLFDQVAPAPALLADGRISHVVGDLADAATIARVLGDDTDSVFHLAAVVSAGAEADFDLGWHINLDGTRHLCEAVRTIGRPAKLVFASSLAAYGGQLPDPVTDETPATPETSYGAQKRAGELLVADYARKGFFDGRSMRLPTISVRPGKPNKAASGFASGIAREPLNGIDMACPVRPESCMALMSPRRVIDAFVRLHELPRDRLGWPPTLLLPGLRASMREMAEAVSRNAGNRKLGRIRFEVDPMIQRIVDGWPKETRSAKATALGFQGDASVDAIIKAYIADELGG
ncbi:MAG: SDR family oxidoreductase [Alphaproteobacteria bacterium]|nr:SDR family oxidoreductase [Alphaproteobacteria bacterium]